MTATNCRHLDSTIDWCSAKMIHRPHSSCVGCDMYEPRGTGLGDIVEKVIDTVTLGKVPRRLGYRWELER